MPFMGVDETKSNSRSLALPFAIGGWVVLGLLLSWLFELSLAGQVVLGGLWLIGLLLLARHSVVSLYGPVMAYDFLRVGRKPRIIWFRLAYACILAFVFIWIYLTGIFFSTRYSGSSIQTKELAQIAEAFFNTFMIIQFILVCILTPASVAGSIADEKERRTLEFLLATDLRDREILFGKLASRVGSILLFLATGLPILGMIQFFGGIDPNLVIAGFLATFLTILSLAALSIAASVLSRKARDAIALTYLAATAYVVLSLIVYALAHAPALRGTFDLFGYSIRPEDCAYPLVAGNPFFQVIDLIDGRRAQSPQAIVSVVRDYTLFHLLVIVLLVSWAALRLRPIALGQLFGSKRPLLKRLLERPVSTPAPTRAKKPAVQVHGAPASRRPDVGETPILWKEVFVDSGLRLGLFAKIITWGLIACSFFPIGIILWDAWIEYRSWGSNTWSSRWDIMAREMNAYSRAVGTMVASMIFLAVTVRGSGSISGERDKHTLDVLLTTPLSASKILWGKWWGCLLGMRWAWAWLFLVWFVGMALGGIHPVLMIPLFASTAIYASGFAWIGIFCSLHFSTTLKASIAAIFSSMMLGGGYFLIFAFCCALPLSFSGSVGRSVDVIVDALSSISPPVNLAWLPMYEFRDRELSLFSRDLPFAPFWILGLIAWGVLSLALSRMCLDKFRRMANRLPVEPRRNPWIETGPMK
jgi:ABC-type transport system involved in multi-copper enzyme maturation permease subunit